METKKTPGELTLGREPVVVRGIPCTVPKLASHNGVCHQMVGGVGVPRLAKPNPHTQYQRMLTHEDEKLIARAIVAGLAKWSWICLLTALGLWLFWYIIANA